MGINLGSGKEHRVIDMANMVNELTSNEAGIKYVERRDWDVEDGLKKVHDWFVENWEDIDKNTEF